MKKSDFLSLLIFSIILVFPILLHIHSTFPRLDTDYDSNLPIYRYMVDFFWVHYSLPFFIPFAGKGMPVFGDPLNSFLNPLLSLPLLFLGINVGFRITLFLNILFSGVSMFYLLKSVGVKRQVQLCGSFLYMSSGTLVAQIASGHIEKMLVYPLVPLFLLFSLKSVFFLRDSIIVAVIIAATVYSGDLYATWFFFLFFIVIRSYYFFVNKKSFTKVVFPILVVPLSIILSSIKLESYFFDVYPVLERYFPINPYQGSVHFFLLPLLYVMPFQVSFYDRPFFQHHLGFSFNWYEYYSFLSPLPFLFLWQIRRIWKLQLVRILLLLIIVGSLYLSLGFLYSPFFWFFHFLHNAMPFRVPQRIVLPLTSVVTLLLSVCADSSLKGKKKKSVIVFIIFAASIVWTTSIFWQTLCTTFPKNLTTQPALIKRFSQINIKKDAVVTFVPQTQLFLTKENIPIANYYYGWIQKGTETYIKNGSYELVRLMDKKPKFVLTNVHVLLTSYGYTNVLKNDTIAIWKKD